MSIILFRQNANNCMWNIEVDMKRICIQNAWLKFRTLLYVTTEIENRTIYHTHNIETSTSQHSLIWNTTNSFVHCSWNNSYLRNAWLEIHNWTNYLTAQYKHVVSKVNWVLLNYLKYVRWSLNGRYMYYTALYITR